MNTSAHQASPSTPTTPVSAPRSRPSACWPSGRVVDAPRPRLPTAQPARRSRDWLLPHDDGPQPTGLDTSDQMRPSPPTQRTPAFAYVPQRPQPGRTASTTDQRRKPAHRRERNQKSQGSKYRRNPSPTPTSCPSRTRLTSWTHPPSTCRAPGLKAGTRRRMRSRNRRTMPSPSRRKTAGRYSRARRQAAPKIVTACGADSTYRPTLRDANAHPNSRPEPELDQLGTIVNQRVKNRKQTHGHRQRRTP